ncbi:MAG TPA: purine nucleoside permease [Bryobacteraceae bacterium]|nr:purine nucleoside permease [Bryobacteraceae bacterium]
MRSTALFLFAAVALTARFSAAKDPVIPVKVVVVTMFERGADTGDEPGELQYWVERNHLDRVLPFPQGYHDLRMNREGVLAVLTGMGTAKAAGSIMALGLDPRFDLRKAYWVVAGIAGVDPADASLGSAAWAEWVVDGDLGYEIDAREIPADWPTGFVPLGKSVPYEQPKSGPDRGEAYHLNPALVDWAFHLTEHVALADSEPMRNDRARYTQANAQRPPFVLKGDVISSSTFWSGSRMSQWANDWVKYHTGGKGNYVTTGMEDTGTLSSLQLLAKAGRADWNRVLVLRTASDFDSPPPGVTAAQNLARNRGGQFSGFLPAIESAWRVGNTVVAEILAHWATYKDTPPTSKPN